MRGKPTTTGSLCVVEIGFTRLLLPMAKGLKVVELLNGAVEVEHDFSERRDVAFLLGEQPRLELAVVRADQVRAKPAPKPPAEPQMDLLDSPRRPAAKLLRLPKPD